MSSHPFFEEYLSHHENSEVPKLFSRWSLIAGVGALLGRQYTTMFGQFPIYPNLFCMLMGSSGTKKSTAIKTMKYYLQQAGYNTIAASKSTKEKFLIDLSELDGTNSSAVDILDQNIFGGTEGSSKPDAEMFIMADEFNDFFGNGNMEFISLLGSLYEYHGVFENRTKNHAPVVINNPTISILGGNTPTGFALAFPPEALGQGFFSRILLIHGEPNGKRIAFPSIPSERGTKAIIDYLKQIKASVGGCTEIQGGARELLEKIYGHGGNVSDQRFTAYFNRRFTHLLKLCLIFSAIRLSGSISELDIIYANTVLTYAESFMPKALGEFGKGKNSSVSHKVLDIITTAPAAVTFKMLWQQVINDVTKMPELQEVLINLIQAEKIIGTRVGKEHAYLPITKRITNNLEGMVDYSLLSSEERNMVK